MAAVRQVLADPQQIVTAYNALQAQTTAPDDAQLVGLRRRITDAEAQLTRLARAIRLADDEAVADALTSQMNAAVQAKKLAEAELAGLRTTRPAPRLAVEDPAVLAELSEWVAAWLDPSGNEQMQLVLEGLELTVYAGADEPSATGSLPVPATFEPHSHGDVRPVVSKDGYVF